MVRNGYFGDQDYFKSLCDTVEVGKDFYLLGSDFGSYLEAQVLSSYSFEESLNHPCGYYFFLILEFNIKYDNRLLLIKHSLNQRSGLR